MGRESELRLEKTPGTFSCLSNRLPRHGFSSSGEYKARCGIGAESFLGDLDLVRVDLDQLLSLGFGKPEPDLPE